MENGKKKIEVIKKLVEMTKDIKDVVGWVNRIGWIASQAEYLSLDKIKWNESPNECARSVVELVMAREKLSEFEEMLKNLS